MRRFATRQVAKVLAVSTVLVVLAGPAAPIVDRATPAAKGASISVRHSNEVQMVPIAAQRDPVSPPGIWQALQRILPPGLVRLLEVLGVFRPASL